MCVDAVLLMAGLATRERLAHAYASASIKMSEIIEGQTVGAVPNLQNGIYPRCTSTKDVMKPLVHAVFGLMSVRSPYIS
jgi:hypothetical protein